MGLPETGSDTGLYTGLPGDMGVTGDVGDIGDVGDGVEMGMTGEDGFIIGFPESLGILITLGEFTPGV